MQVVTNTFITVTKEDGGYERKPIPKAYEVSLLPGIQTTVHKDPGGYGWTVNEGTTGLLIANGCTRKEAINNAIYKLQTMGLERTQEAIKASLKIIGVIND